MFFRKNEDKGLLREVSDTRQIVYDFRRRSHELFENYRALNYKKPPLYNLESLKAENTEVLERLFATNAVDSGNEDCLIEHILGPIRSGIQYLDDQRVDHKDFYYRYGIKRKTDSIDFTNMDAYLAKKEEAMEREHKHTQKLWAEYCNYNLKED